MAISEVKFDLDDLFFRSYPSNDRPRIVHETLFQREEFHTVCSPARVQAGRALSPYTFSVTRLFLQIPNSDRTNITSDFIHKELTKQGEIDSKVLPHLLAWSVPV